MKKYVSVYDDQFGCTFVSLYVLIWRAHYIHIMMGFLYDVFFYVTLRYLSYATIIMHSHGISAIGIYKVLFMKQYITRNEQHVDIFHHDCSNLR